MLPNTNYHPAAAAQLLKVSSIPPTIAFYFLLPVCTELVFPFWETPAMPEVAIDKDGNLCAYENEVWASWQSSVVYAKTETAGVN